LSKIEAVAKSFGGILIESYNIHFSIFRLMKLANYLFVLGIFITGSLSAQKTSSDLAQDYVWRNIGPANMMGRIASIKALDSDYRHVLVASASGGVFKSTNAGMTWEAIFDDYGAGSIGSIAMFQPNPDIIWVGTGESANRNSSAYGDGIYKSEDGGKTFKNVGLETTHQIAEIATHPTNPDIAYAAAVGHLWGYTGERGLFKTEDGGKTWDKLTNGLPNDGKTGATEIIMDPRNPDVLFAGFYHRLRKPYTFTSGGEEGGLFKSVDGGKSWRKITKGLAKGSSGMIDISIHLANPDIMVMAYEADQNIKEGAPGSGPYRSDDGGETWRFLRKHHTRPFYHGQIEIDPIDPNNVYLVSREAMNSIDGGETFQGRRWQADGGDDHDMWISPTDNRVIYLATDQGAKLSVDMGKTWLSFNNMAIGQYYAIGVDNRDPYWVVGGLQDNGLWMTPSNSRENRGVLNMHSTWIAEGDGFHAQIDPTDWRTVYTVNHVGFVARQNIETREYAFITPNPETIVNYDKYVDPDFKETKSVYTIDPGEHWFFRERPERPLLPPQFRFNWSSPFIISPNNPNTVYFGGNYLFKSVDRGDSWRIISPDLTTNDAKWRNPSNSGGLTNSNTGGENHFNIITIAESPVDETVVWAGTDDGNVQLTQDGGVSWTNVKSNFKGVPDKIWVSRVEASHFDKGTAYVTFDNHRYDDNKPYVFKTTDFGETWTNISAGLPEKYSVYVIKEDMVNPNLLFLGTEYGVHFSVDGGASWESIKNEMATVAIHDLVIHEREGDLVAGTHGRSIWIMDDISALRQIDDANGKSLHTFKPKTATKWVAINTGRKQPAFMFRGKNPDSGAQLHYYLDKPSSVKVTIEDISGKYKRELTDKGTKGINRVLWRLDFNPNAADIAAFKSNLESAITTLRSRVNDKDLVAILDKAGADLPGTSSTRQLNALRKTLVDNFNAYTGGKPIFGGKIGRMTAPEGDYKVTVTANGQSSSNYFKVREDPLKKK